MRRNLSGGLTPGLPGQASACGLDCAGYACVRAAIANDCSSGGERHRSRQPARPTEGRPQPRLPAFPNPVPGQHPNSLLRHKAFGFLSLRSAAVFPRPGRTDDPASRALRRLSALAAHILCIESRSLPCTGHVFLEERRIHGFCQRNCRGESLLRLLGVLVMRVTAPEPGIARQGRGS